MLRKGRYNVRTLWNPLKAVRRKDDPGQEAPPETTAPESPDLANRERVGWVSPAYTQSRTIRLNPLAAAANRCVGALPCSADVEAYKVLRTQILQKTAEGGGRTIMVTSALASEGKTTTAINLAFAFAREFKQTVLLLDCDLRHQRIHDLLGIKSDKGLANHLLNDEPISNLIIWPGFEKLTLISGGRTIQNSAEVLGSQRMKEMLHDMKTRYPDRYIFIDAPAILSNADSSTLAPQVDHILMVVAAGITPLADVRKALEVLPADKVLGLILNKYAGN